jgi:hypothetical protein
VALENASCGVFLIANGNQHVIAVVVWNPAKKCCFPITNTSES